MMSGLDFHIGPVTVAYRSRRVVDTDAISLPPGKFIGLLGPNGAGKSTWLKALIGAFPATVSSLSLGGRDLLSLPRIHRARAIAYLSQTRTGPALMSVRDVIALGRHPHGGRDTDNHISRIINQLDLHALADRAYGALSGGEQARVLFGRMLAVNADVILADEPIASLDPYHAHDCLNLLRSEARRGRTVIASLHDISLAERYCDQCLVMSEGRFVSTDRATLSETVLRDVFQMTRERNGLSPISRRQ